MIDAYTHLDVTHHDPITELGARVAAAGVSQAVVVETWAGTESRWLDVLSDTAAPDRRIVRCLRDDARAGRGGGARADGWRVATATLADARLGPLVIDDVMEVGGLLMPHAEDGIAALADALCPLLADRPGIDVWVPHLAWPWVADIASGAWRQAIARLRDLPNVRLVVSAIPTFSTQPWPHDDVLRLAREAACAFGAPRLLPGSDFPYCSLDRYADCLRTAAAVIHSAARDETATKN